MVREITVSWRLLVSNRHEFTVKRRLSVSKRHEFTDKRRLSVSKRHEITVKRRETVSKRVFGKHLVAAVRMSTGAAAGLGPGTYSMPSNSSG
jgi:hypothetical protein